MGTNYYAKENECKCCGRYDEVHVGKQSYGWAFIFANKFPSKQEWVEYLSDKPIINEYGEAIHLFKLLDSIEDTKNKLNYKTYLAKEDRKYAEYKDNPDDFEYLDDEGYRIGKREFS